MKRRREGNRRKSQNVTKYYKFFRQSPFLNCVLWMEQDRMSEQKKGRAATESYSSQSTALKLKHPQQANSLDGDTLRDYEGSLFVRSM